MAMVINTNISSLNAQRQLSGSANKLGTAMERLSSGLRINSAKDDAAGLAISSRMTTQITGLNVAQRNANDGISLAQTAEGALSTIGNNLQRIRELAVQSRNATNSDDDRASLQKEVAQLKAEIDRVAENTSFNDTKLLDGSFTSKAFQVGANQGQTIDISSIANASVASLGSWTAVDTPTKSKELSLSDTDAVVENVAADGGTADVTMKFGGLDITVTLTNNGSSTKTFSAEEVAKALDKQISAKMADLNTEGFSISGSLAAGTLVASNTTGGAKDISIVGVKTVATALEADGTGVAKETVNEATPGASTTGFEKLDVSTVAGADNAILAMDAALKEVNSARADLGAIQNRFESVVSNLATTSENLTASRSRILDADFAVETANLSSAQVLQQAGTAMVAQANQLPQNVLSLLR